MRAPRCLLFSIALSLGMLWLPGAAAACASSNEARCCCPDASSETAASCAIDCAQPGRMAQEDTAILSGAGRSFQIAAVALAPAELEAGWHGVGPVAGGRLPPVLHSRTYLQYRILRL